MTVAAADANAFPKRTTQRDSIEFKEKAVLTAAGAVSTETKSDPGLSIAKNAGTTGQYDITFPNSPGDVYLTFEFYSPAGTIADSYIKALNEGAGTASIICVSPTGTAAYGASGDRIYMTVDIDSRAS